MVRLVGSVIFTSRARPLPFAARLVAVVGVVVVTVGVRVAMGVGVMVMVSVGALPGRGVGVPVAQVGVGAQVRWQPHALERDRQSSSEGCSCAPGASPRGFTRSPCCVHDRRER